MYVSHSPPSSQRERRREGERAVGGSAKGSTPANPISLRANLRRVLIIRHSFASVSNDHLDNKGSFFQVVAAWIETSGGD